MRRAVLLLIALYQKYLSPYKGFCCAYRIHTGRAGCSALGYRSVRRYGVVAGWAVLHKRITLCGVAHNRSHHLTSVRSTPHTQRGGCDVGCDLPCDIPFDIPCEVTDCASCDLPKRKPQEDKKERFVYIPPRRPTLR
jgi:uncharacterized protein